MGRCYEQLDDGLVQFIERQHLFFVGTAPTELDGLLNLSPKGLDTFRILGPRTVGYLDLVGSGIETVAHLRQNGRLTIMFCAFEGKPKILRLYGQGRVVEPGEPGWDDLVARFPPLPGIRSVIVLEVGRIADTCGWGVPLYEYQGERPQLPDFAATKGADGLERYKAKNNRTSLDGLDGLRTTQTTE